MLQVEQQWWHLLALFVDNKWNHFWKKRGSLNYPWVLVFEECFIFTLKFGEDEIFFKGVETTHQPDPSFFRDHFQCKSTLNPLEIVEVFTEVNWRFAYKVNHWCASGGGTPGCFGCFGMRGWGPICESWSPTLDLPSEPPRKPSWRFITHNYIHGTGIYLQYIWMVDFYRFSDI